MQLNNTAIIGNGLISTQLQQFVNCSQIFDSKNISDLCYSKFDTVYIAAPSSNRIQAENNPDQDAKSVHKILDTLALSDVRQIVLISTCDTQMFPKTSYGKNRLLLENTITGQFTHHHIIRLPALIGTNIKKNMLFDIKNKTKWMNKINLNIKQQWYDLDDLEEDLKRILNSEKINSINNLVSEPILNLEIIQNLELDQSQFSCGPACHYNLKPYKYTKEQIFEKIRLYLRG